MSLINKFLLSLSVLSVSLFYSMEQSTENIDTDIKSLYSQINLKFLCAYNIYKYINNNNKNQQIDLCEKIESKEYPSDLDETFALIKDIEENYTTEQKKVILQCIAGTYDNSNRTLLSQYIFKH